MMKVTAMSEAFGAITTMIVLAVIIGVLAVGTLVFTPSAELIDLIISIVTGVIAAIIWLPKLWAQLAAAAKKPRKYSLDARQVSDLAVSDSK